MIRPRVFSIGSGCPLMLEKLIEAGVTLILDVRQAPGSLARHARAAGIGHHHFDWLSSPYLGRTRSEWSTAQYELERRLCDPQRQQALVELLGYARAQTCALVGRQRQHARCHRAVIAQRLNLVVMPLGEQRRGDAPKQLGLFHK